MKHKNPHDQRRHDRRMAERLEKSKATPKIKKPIGWRLNPEAVKANLLEMKDILDKLGIKFWLTHGVLLGAVRQGGLIPYDHDLDLRILALDWFPELADKFIAAGFQAKTVKWYGPYVTKIMLKKRGVKTDLALEYYYEPEDAYLCLAMQMRKPLVQLAASFYEGDHFTELLGSSFRIPYPPEKLLEQYYGSDWRTPKTAFPGWVQGGEMLDVRKYLRWFARHPKQVPKEMRIRNWKFWTIG